MYLKDRVLRRSAVEHSGTGRIFPGVGILIIGKERRAVDIPTERGRKRDNPGVQAHWMIGKEPK